MDVLEFSRSIFMSFLASIAVTVILWFFLYTLHIDHIMYLAALVGMYVFAGFGINRLVEDGVIENNASRFVLAIVCILIYSVVFVYVMPLVFGPNVFPQPLNLANYGINIGMVFTTEIFLAIFGLIVLAINYADYRN